VIIIRSKGGGGKENSKAPDFSPVSGGSR